MLVIFLFHVCTTSNVMGSGPSNRTSKCCEISTKMVLSGNFKIGCNLVSFLKAWLVESVYPVFLKDIHVTLILLRLLLLTTGSVPVSRT